MAKAGKLIILILCLLLGASAFVVVSAFNQKKSLEQTNKTLTKQLSQGESRELKLIQEAKSLQAQLQEAQGQKSNLKVPLGDQL